MADTFGLLEEVFPIPEALTKTAWEIVGGETPKVMPGKLIVPLSPDQHDQVLRTHELAHIKWSPKEIPKDLNPAIVAMVEDARITWRMRLAKVKLEPGYPSELVAYTVAKLRATGDKWGAFMFRVGMSGMPGQEVVDAALRSEDEGMEAVLTSLRNSAQHPNDFQWTVNWTRHLMAMIKAEKDERDQRQQERQQSASRRSEGERAAEREFTQTARRQAENDLAGANWRARASGELQRAETHQRYKPTGVPHNNWWTTSDTLDPWGDMAMEEPPLTQRMPGRFGRQRRPCDTGSALNYPARLWQDQKVFGRKLRGRGGSVLIDGSGSMSLTPEQIWKILEHAPGATIAIYGSAGTDCRRGILRVLAKKGLVVKAKLARSPGGGNVVDFPALEWLAKQEEPRVWVSDGHVTGKGERHGMANQAQCFDLCKRKRVLRTPHLKEAIELFQAIRLRRAGIRSAAYKLGE